MKELQTLTAININKPIIDVNHKDLKRISDSVYDSQCPQCKEGILTCKRDPKTLKLLDFDYCSLCGQSYHYIGGLPLI